MMSVSLDRCAVEALNYSLYIYYLKYFCAYHANLNNFINDFLFLLGRLLTYLIGNYHECIE